MLDGSRRSVAGVAAAAAAAEAAHFASSSSSVAATAAALRLISIDTSSRTVDNRVNDPSIKKWSRPLLQ